ncbi:MAG: hypothetical protein HOY69_02270 [Streptomyces sp.]|nr:hypothetical protein [Streptomyces sp.]
MTRIPTTALRAGASVAVLASGALLLAACSSGGSGSSSPAAKASGTVAASASASGTGDMAAYRTCLSQHGVKLPSFSPGAGRPSGRPTDRPSGMPSGRPSNGFGGGFPGMDSSDPAMQKAMKACESLRPQFNRGSGAGGGADASAYQAFTSCLKDHGVTLSTPSPGSTGRPRGMFGGINTSDPKTAQAYNTCKALLPSRPTPSTT